MTAQGGGACQKRLAGVVTKRPDLVTTHRRCGCAWSSFTMSVPGVRVGEQSMDEQHRDLVGLKRFDHHQSIVGALRRRDGERALATPGGRLTPSRASGAEISLASGTAPPCRAAPATRARDRRTPGALSRPAAVRTGRTSAVAANCRAWLHKRALRRRRRCEPRPAARRVLRGDRFASGVVGV